MPDWSHGKLVGAAVGAGVGHWPNGTGPAAHKLSVRNMHEPSWHGRQAGLRSHSWHESWPQEEGAGLVLGVGRGVGLGVGDAVPGGALSAVHVSRNVNE